MAGAGAPRLVDLDEVGTTRSYAYDDATLMTPGRYTARSPMTSASFKKLFFEQFPALRGMAWDNVCVRGGAVLDLLLARPVHDLDFFIVGLADDAAVAKRAAQLVDFLLHAERATIALINEAYEKSKGGDAAGRVARRSSWRRAAVDAADDDEDEDEAPVTYGAYGVGGDVTRYMSEPMRIDIKAVRAGSVVTLKAGVLPVAVQIVLCSFESPEALASSADMHVCGAIFDGETVRMNGEARWSLENMAIRVVDGRFPRMTRLKKYFDKGFDVVLPGLDVTKMPTGYLPLGLLDAVVTPKLRFAYSAVEGKKISLSRFLDSAATDDDGAETGAAPAPGLSSARARRAAHGGSYGDAGDALESRTVIYKNIELLAQYAATSSAAAASGGAAGAAEGAPSAAVAAAVPDFSVFAEADFVGDVLKPWPSLTPRQVENTYAGIRASIFSSAAGSTLNLGQLAKFVPVCPVRRLLADVAASAADEPIAAACERHVSAAVASQMAASNSVLPSLEAFFEGKLPPVEHGDLKPMYGADAAAFYGAFAK